MLPVSPYSVRLTTKLRTEEALRRYETHRLLQEAGAYRHHWIRQYLAFILHRMGHLLVGAGHRLQRYRPVEPLPLDKQMAG
jgi:hypothetical protein